ncbi:MAG: T9SS type A sorting domain-containing protein [Bacteroidia bacterium]|nr:T9SS type A sorting domain-containing protein [Bacteroidia bacterium]MDW8346221.1 LamG-like jellyroll fold domain-containing protein [Bacteroidia bacterium]
MKKIYLLGIYLTIVVFSTDAQNYCMRFYGHGTGDIDRVKIPIDAPEKPVDLSNDFTIEFEIKASLSDNPLGSSAVQGNNDDWTLGHIIIDRDIFGAGDYGDYGISLVAGKVAFGVNNGSQSFTLIGSMNVADNVWHHIAVTRNSTTGAMQIYIDGTLNASVPTGPAGNISYRNGRTTSYPNDPYIVIGAEKHDYNPLMYPSYNGYIDELRISNSIRYTTNFIPPSTPFTTDANTLGLYHFDEGSGTTLIDASAHSGGPSNGIVKFGGSGTPGPVWILKSSVTSAEDYNLNLSHGFYPNPFDKHFYLKNNLKPNQNLLIFDVLGREIQFELSDNTVYISKEQQMPKGLYLVCVSEDGKIIYHSIMLHE